MLRLHLSRCSLCRRIHAGAVLAFKTPIEAATPRTTRKRRLSSWLFAAAASVAVFSALLGARSITAANAEKLDKIHSLEVENAKNAEMLRSAQAEKTKAQEELRRVRARLNDLKKEIEALGIARPIRLRDRKAFSIVQPGRDRIELAGQFNPLYIQQVRFRIGDEPNGSFIPIYKGGPTPGPETQPIRFHKVSPKLKLDGRVIVADLEFIPYAEIRDRFPHFFTPDRMQRSRTFLLARDGIVADPDLLIITEPHELQKVQRTEQISGRMSIRGRYPVVLVKPVVGGEWYIQPAVEEFEDGEFTAQVFFGEPSTRSGTRFHVIVIAANDKRQAEQFKEGSSIKSLPVGLPRSRVITVERE